LVSTAPLFVAAPTKHITLKIRLYRRRVKHYTNGSTERLRREIVTELCSYNAGITVWAGDLAPDYSDLRALNFSLCPIDEGNLLAEVEVGGFGVIDTLYLDETCVGVGIALSTLITQVTTLNVESVTVFRRHDGGFSERQ
jgi:hypothetical protein